MRWTGPAGTRGMHGTYDVYSLPAVGRRGRVAGVSALVLACALDLLIMILAGPAALPGGLVLAVGLAALLWPAARRPSWFTPVTRTAVPAAASAAWTATGVLADLPGTLGPGEAVILLSLLLVAIRTCPTPWMVACGLLTALALWSLPLRVGEPSILPALLVPQAITAGFAGYLRAMDERRRLAVTATRRDERLDMAANLHDFVAHHVTGMLVQTQVARMLARTEPDRLDSVLDGIENAAVEALTSMRRIVGLLRDADGGRALPGDRRPLDDLSVIPELVDGLPRRGGPKATLIGAEAVPATLPSQVRVAAYRIVQEALTNVLRHATDATVTTVTLGYDGHDLHVTVRDNGSGRAALPGRPPGGGFGLVGLTERVTTLGGTLRAGTHADGGWEVLATLPADEPSTRPSTQHSAGDASPGPRAGGADAQGRADPEDRADPEFRALLARTRCAGRGTGSRRTGHPRGE